MWSSCSGQRKGEPGTQRNGKDSADVVATADRRLMKKISSEKQVLQQVAQHGRELAIEKFDDHLRVEEPLYNSLWVLSGARLICHSNIWKNAGGLTHSLSIEASRLVLLRLVIIERGALQRRRISSGRKSKTSWNRASNA